MKKCQQFRKNLKNGPLGAVGSDVVGADFGEQLPLVHARPTEEMSTARHHGLTRLAERARSPPATFMERPSRAAPRT